MATDQAAPAHRAGTPGSVRITRRRGGSFRLDTEMLVRRPIDDVFEFFAAPQNLELITPPWLRFRLLPPAPVEMGSATVIDYRLRLHGLPLRWRSAISDWEPPRRFVDRQLRGPYRLWIHEHSFHERPEGTEVRDRVDYTLPLRGLGVARFVARDLRGIFTYRQRALADLFD